MYLVAMKSENEKMEKQHKLGKVPKISSFSPNTVPRENKSEAIINNANTVVNIEPNVELDNTVRETSEVFNPTIHHVSIQRYE